MKYIDIFDEAYRIKNSTAHKDAFHARLDVRVLAWTVNHEHAVFHLLGEVHPATACIWFQYFRGEGDNLEYTIHKIQRIDGNRWREAEVSVGSIPFVNNNPFDPRKQNAASNTAESVFPQNEGKSS